MHPKLDFYAEEFFVAGGTLSVNAPSYIHRPADDELFTLAQAGKLCYILTPRQMGKSSLMVRAAHRLREAGVKAITLDLTELGEQVTAEQWYFGLLTRFARRLRLQTDLEGWWQAHSGEGYVKRFTDFLRDVVLAEIQERIVIFIDEIDTTLKLDFRDDFFAALRALYNARAEESELARLTFVLLGVASPPDLIKDRTRTPFNIGQGIILQEFSREDAVPLQAGLESAFPGQGDVLFDRVYHWTGGHPYLTQKLCLSIAANRDSLWDATRVDALVKTLFLSEEARNESNLQYVQDLLLKHPQRVALLHLYRQVLRGAVPDDVQNPLHNALKLVGLVKAENGVLRVRNEIYRRVFDRAWVGAHLPRNWTRVVAVVAVAVAAFAVGLIAYSAWVDGQARSFYYDFDKTDAPTERLHALAQIFHQRNPLNPRGYAGDALNKLFGLPRAEQLALFQPGLPEDDLATVIGGLYTTLADVDETGATTPLLAAMRDALPAESAVHDTQTLRTELDAWIEGRTLYAQGQYTAAVESYTRAVNVNYANYAVWYEKARVRLELGQTDEALRDLEEALAQANKSNEPTPTPEPTELPETEEAEAPTRAPTVAPAVTATPGGTTPTPKAGSPAPATTAAPETPRPTTPILTPPFTPAPTATPESASIQSQFRDLGQIRRAIKALIYRYPEAAFVFANASPEQYTYLREAGLMLTLTPTPTPSLTSTVTTTPKIDMTPTPTLANIFPTPTVISAPKLGDTWIRLIDKAVMMYVPAGEFLMGSNNTQFQIVIDLCVKNGITRNDCQKMFLDEQPVHKVILDSFWIDQTEISVAQFQQFVIETGYQTNAEQVGWGWTWSRENTWAKVQGADWQHPKGSNSEAVNNHPVVQISWDDAVAYCQWTNASLPSEAQWEYAARGPEGWIYPWGDNFEGTRLNFCDANCEFSWADKIFNDGYTLTAPVGSYLDGRSWCGTLDMVGNVWEWTADWFGAYSSEQQINPTGATSGIMRVVRGGAWYFLQRSTRTANRMGLDPLFWTDGIGFRCVVASQEE